jgi:hypothetical protein
LDTERPTSTPAGWYPGPDGVQRYWDGTAWLSIPPPSVPDAPVIPANPRRGKKAAVIGAVVGLLLLGGGGTALAVNAANERAEYAAAEQKAEEEAAAEAAEAAEAATAEAEAEAAQVAADDAERALREESVAGIEASVKKMAKGHVKDDLIDGPVLEVTCSPVAGGSIDDLLQATTEFSCFVATEDNGDGTMSGHYYHATMNWDTGEYTYGFGES